MKLIGFKHFFAKYLYTIVIAANIVYGIILGFYVRNSIIKDSKNNISYNIDKSITAIQNQIESNHFKINTLAEIVASQINTPKAFYDFNSLFKFILSSENSLNSIFIVLSPNAVDLDQSLYPLLDTLNRYNVVWRKNSENIVFIDSLENTENNYYFETVKNTRQITTFDNSIFFDKLKTEYTKKIAIPIFESSHFIGVIGYEMNFNFLNTILIQNNLNKNTFITDETGIIIFDREKKITINKKFTDITNPEFESEQNNILRNINFIKRKGNQILFFNTFKPNPLPLTWKIGTFNDSKSIYLSANLYFILILFITIMFGFIISLFFNTIINRIKSNFEGIIKSAENIQKGNIFENIQITNEYKELIIISDFLDKIRNRLIKLTNIFKQIQEQNISERLEEISENDLVAVSINKTIDAIQERAKSRKESLIVKERTEWINKGLSIIHEASKIGENSIEILTDKINSKISTYSDAFLSSFFIIFNDEKNNETVLKSVSTFAIDKRKAYNKIIKFGEGVVGSVAIERKKQYFDKIPDDYHIIIGGLSEMKPKSILVQPLEYEGEFYGILEIAFLKRLQDFELEFFDKASAEIALSIKNILNNISTNSLLDKMKLQTKEIEKAQELLQAKIKEITSKEKEAVEREAAMESMINAVNNTLMTIEYTTDGILLNVNKKYIDTMNFTLDELKGVNVLDLVKTERAELEQVIRRVSQGEYFEKTMKRFTKYGEVRWLHSTYTPYYDTTGKITKILYFAFDVTETKEQSEKLEKEIRMLKKQIKILREKI